jgi:hypothetical protein
MSIGRDLYLLIAFAWILVTDNVLLILHIELSSSGLESCGVDYCDSESALNMVCPPADPVSLEAQTSYERWSLAGC